MSKLEEVKTNTQRKKRDTNHRHHRLYETDSDRK